MSLRTSTARARRGREGRKELLTGRLANDGDGSMLPWPCSCSTLTFGNHTRKVPAWRLAVGQMGVWWVRSALFVSLRASGCSLGFGSFFVVAVFAEVIADRRARPAVSTQLTLGRNVNSKSTPTSALEARRRGLCKKGKFSFSPLRAPSPSGRLALYRTAAVTRCCRAPLLYQQFRLQIALPS